MISLKNKKILVAYFSRAGENYVNNNVENLNKGNTEVVAEKIRNLTDGILFKIQPKKEYSKEYRKCVLEAKGEFDDKLHPAIKGSIKDFESFDIIFLGYPNWMSTCPMPVFTFLESYDFKGKIIVPFCTNEGSGLGNSISDIENTVKDATVLPGLPIRGSLVSQSDDKIKEWLNNLFSDQNFFYLIQNF